MLKETNVASLAKDIKVASEMALDITHPHSIERTWQAISAELKRAQNETEVQSSHAYT